MRPDIRFGLLLGLLLLPACAAGRRPAEEPPVAATTRPAAASLQPAAGDEGVPLAEAPPLPAGTVLFDSEAQFGGRGRVGGFASDPSKYAVYYDQPGHTGIPDAVAFRYRKVPGPSFSGSYVIIRGDLSGYQTLTFWVKGARGGEAFELGMNDTVSNKREDAVFIGSIYRYLPGGVTQAWQQVRVPLADFYGPDLSRVYTLVFLFNEEGEGRFWVDDIRLHTEPLVDREAPIREAGELWVDDFDHSDVNLLGRKANAYKRLPSVAEFTRVAQPRIGESGRSLKLSFDKRAAGWCGYYTLFNQIDGAYFDMSPYKAIAFWVRGGKGAESFEIGMADRSWLTIGDSVKAGPIEKYLPKGVTTRWQEVVIPLADFGKLEWGQMGSFTINLHETGRGVVYLENLRLIRKTDEDLLKEWEEGS
ncbi:MAG: hypothetical protein COV76_00650 [Candidatus Omnitrophica bacterium CG11_big_fil_rev_8_21_14_0_20_64_10]|nr:MAG: hypothetical protein COV76_00650 [Candidatus Omnitrophica bacterium CG11_big_fil_rev_8_21_14_0_20_64_10]